MRVALYLRRSTLDLQSESLTVQEEVLRTYAAAHDLAVVDVFRDSASGRSSKRKDFQRLVSVIDAGAPFDAVLVRDVSRFGRFAQPDEHAYWEFRFLLKGVRVLYVDEPFPDETSPYAVLMKDLKRLLASEFSREKAARTTTLVAALIEQMFGVRYDRDHVGRVLHGLGWSHQKPARRALERNEEAIEQWKRERWPVVIKTARGWMPTSSS